MFASRRECHETMCDSVPEKVSWESISGKANRRRMTSTACDAIRIFRTPASDEMILYQKQRRSYHFLVSFGRGCSRDYSAGCPFYLAESNGGFDRVTSLYIFVEANAFHKLRVAQQLQLRNSYESGILNLRTAYSRFNGRATAFATFCSRMRPFRAVRRPACGNERPMGRALVGPHGALAWSRISIDIARVRSGSLNSMHCVGASCETRCAMSARGMKNTEQNVRKGDWTWIHRRRTTRDRMI